MQLDSRKISYAIVIGVLGAVGPFVFWRVFLQQLPVTGVGEATLSTRFEEQTQENKPIEESSDSRLRELLPQAGTALFLDPSRDMLNVYERGTGLSFSINPATLKVFPLSEEKLENFIGTTWSPNGREVISLFEQKEQSEYRYFDYDSRRVSPLVLTTKLIAFSPDGRSLVSVRELHDTTEIWISEPDGSGDWLLMATRADVQNLWWPMTDHIAMLTRRPDGRDDLFLVNLNAELRILIEKQNDLEVLWARGGDSALISSEDDSGEIALRMFKTESGRTTSLGLNTKASKCAWHRQARGLTCGIHSSSTTSRDTVVTMNADGTGLVTRFEAPDDIWIGLVEPVSLPRDNGVAFINLFDERPYILTW